MAHPSTLHRFRLDLSDVDRGVYEKLDIRVARHPSESEPFLLSRVLAYALNYEADLSFSKEGLGTPDEPCLSISDPGGGFRLWIEIGIRVRFLSGIFSLDLDLVSWLVGGGLGWLVN